MKTIGKIVVGAVILGATALVCVHFNTSLATTCVMGWFAHVGFDLANYLIEE